MRRTFTIAIGILCAGALLLLSSSAPAAPFEKGNPAIGKSLVEKSCISCHVSIYGGDGSRMYTRPEHIVTTPAQLLSRIRICNTFANAGWFPEEETHVAAYLNRSYYHFK